MTLLVDAKFETFDANTPALTLNEIKSLLSEISEWQVFNDAGIQKLSCKFITKKYAHSLKLTHSVASLAESVNHHPVITLEYASVTVVWWSHEIKGLLKNDFIMAAKTAQLYSEITPPFPEIPDKYFCQLKSWGLLAPNLKSARVLGYSAGRAYAEVRLHILPADFNEFNLSEGDLRIATAVLFLRGTVKQNLSLEYFAAGVDPSASRLNTLFKRTGGYTCY